MNDTYLVLTISIVAGVIQAIFWRWVSSIGDSNKENSKRLENFGSELAELRAEVYRDYQSKNNAHIDNQRILESLSDLKTDVKELSHKLDKKVDK